MRIFSLEKYKRNGGFCYDGWAKYCDGQPVENGSIVGTPYEVPGENLEKWTIEKEENVMFKKEDILAGMVVELKDEGLCMVTYNSQNKLSLSGENMWFDFDGFNNQLKRNGTEIKKIYGRTDNKYAHKVSTKDRELLWQRTETKEMTVSELAAEAEQKHGCKIKVIYEVQK